MKNSKAIGSPISQNDRNVNTFSERNFKGSPLSQNDRFVNPFSENFFEGFIAQKLTDVKSFLKYFSEKICVVNRCDPKRIISRRDMIRYRN